MKYYQSQNVFDATVERINRLFDEFDHVIVASSGGKDSTVIFEIALMVAEQRGRLPQPVLFIDEEAEWQCTIDYIKKVMYNPKVQPYWLQIPMKIPNATSIGDPWLYCWEAGKEDKWMQPYDPISIKVNNYKTDRKKKIVSGFLNYHFKDKKACILSGVRVAESPGRLLGLTNEATYKEITWATRHNKEKGQEHYDFRPIYDWEIKDIWKAIHDNNWDYCKLYDYYYQYGVPINEMRVSNLHHVRAIRSIFRLQEIEPQTWNKMVERLSGINTAGHLNYDAFMTHNLELPFMFDNWFEYRDHLLMNLIENKEDQERFAQKFSAMDKLMKENYFNATDEQMCRCHISAILTNDLEFNKINEWVKQPKHRELQQRHRLNKLQGQEQK